MLDSFYTDFYLKNNQLINFLRQYKIYNALPKLVKNGLDRSEQKLKSNNFFWFPFFAYKWLQKQKKCSDKSALKIWAGHSFCENIIFHKHPKNVDIVYGFNGSCLELFQYAKSRGIRCILDQTIAEMSLVHKLLQEEEDLWPNWSLSPFRVKASDRQLLEREQSEQDLADRIICGSDFVKNSLIDRGISTDKISAIALGRRRDGASLNVSLNSEKLPAKTDKLKILFAGTVSLRKGIPYLLQALRQLQGQIPFSCKVAGSIAIKPERVAEYSDVCEFLGRVPRSQMTELYRWADVFVFPSICEGSAMVTHEALSWGLPVITTPNSGSIVTDNSNGVIVNIRDTTGIVNNLYRIAENKLKSNHNNPSYTDVSLDYRWEQEQLHNLLINI